MPNPSSLPKPSKIARYEILREIGRGGMATVYLARDPNFQREVAVKVLPREAMHDSTLYQRFQREARTIASLEHPAIVPVHDFGEEDGQPFLVQRYLSGGSLSARIKAGPLPIAEAAKVLIRIGGALDAAHAKGIVHRDLKPANILFDQYGEAYLSDFGIAQLSESTSPLTGSAILGTPAYMSPEQIRGDGKVDGRADIYALGIVLFEMLTGKTPFKADTPAQMMMMHLANPTPRLPEEKTDLPDTINGVLIRAMAKDPELRFQKASELGSVISAIASGEAPDLSATSATYGYFRETAATRIDAEDGGPRRPSRPVKKTAGEKPAGKSTKKWPAIAIAAVVLCLCGIGGAAGGYALFKDPDALSSLLSPKETATRTFAPTEDLFAGQDSTLRFEPTQFVNNPLATTTETSDLVGDKFEISIGDEISDGVPGPGAGRIETPGLKDIYFFSVGAGQTIYIQIIDVKMTDTLDLLLLDEWSNEVAAKSLPRQYDPRHYDWGVEEFILGGKYTLIIGTDNKSSVGTYRIKLWDVPSPDEFEIDIDPFIEIMDGIPEPGAGKIETPGGKDIFTFSAVAGQIIYIQVIDVRMTDTLNMILLDELNNKVGSVTIPQQYDPRHYDWGVVELVIGGKYTLIIGNDTRISLGTYKLKIWGQGSPG
ncbi:MAG: serine/threonine protein kinase [Anaerolineales bacterium]|nr:serine/threonine protein kinase [Anaerolineales bacterium]